MPYEQMGLFGSPDEAHQKADEIKLPDLAATRQTRTDENHLQAFLPGISQDGSYSQINSLEELKAIALNCSQCRLRSGCRQVVFGVGPENARLMLVGEGPGQEEDNSGIPFVGRAGQLLDRILQAAELPRSTVYIGNVVKCRPPDNRLPNPDEVKLCRHYLEAQIRLVKPSVVVCLGSLASRTVIDPRASISKIRGQWYTRNGIKIIGTFHPAALLRNESYKRPVWEDFKKIRDEYQKLENIEL